MQVKPASILQVDEHPSPDVVSPSSHSSPAPLSKIPSPQAELHAPTGLVAVPHLGSVTQVGEQPSKGLVLPSSQASSPSRVPLPHTVRLHGAGLHTHPASAWQVGEQPSPAVLLPSSHCSGAMILLSPHLGLH